MFPARRWRLVVTSLLFLGALAPLLPISAASASLTEPAASPVPVFDWSMPERYGLDENGDALIDTWAPRDVCNDDATNCRTLGPSSQKPMRPDTWHVDLDACDTTGATSFAWEVIGHPAITVDGGPACDGFSFQAPAEGTYRVALTATGAGGSTTSVREVIVQDFLIVSLGDSYGSGEGNPDHESYVGGPAARWSERRCHRTQWAGSARAAYELEINDPHTSVTFLHLACSGALATTGLLQPYDGVASPEQIGMDPIRPQVDVARELVQGREIDATYVSIGGNDSNFANVVVACLALDPCNPVAQGKPDGVYTDNLLVGGVCGGLTLVLTPILGPAAPVIGAACPFIFSDFIGGFAGKSAERWISEGLIGDGTPGQLDSYRLSRTYADLDSALGARLGLPADHDERVFLSEYVDATRKENGVYCPTEHLPRLLDDYRLPGLTKLEAEWLDKEVEQKLNEVVHHNTARFGWTSVDGIYEGFKNHGLCSETPFMRGLLPETFIVQGDQNGAVHPNRRGHEVYRNRILEAWLPQLYPGAGGTPGIPSDIGDDVEFYVRDFIAGHEARRPEQAPVAVADIDGPIVEGSTVVAENSSYDDGALSNAWSSGDAAVATVAPADQTNPTVTGIDDGATGITLTVTDARGQTSTVTRPVTVQNADPTVTLPETGVIPEGTPLETSATVTDPGVLDTHRAVVDHGDGDVTEATDVVGGTVPIQHTYADDGTYQLRVDATDDDDGSASTIRDVTVTNVAPTVESLSIPIVPIPVGSPVTASATFSDPGTGDTHTQTWSWGDGSTSQTGFAQGAVQTAHAYDEAGLYTVEVVVTDDDGAVARRSVEFVVVYDPTGGFATGGGTVESPAGAYRPDPTITGPATFSFVSKYAKGATVPTGNTAFRFNAADFRFESTEHQWLVVSGTKATFKGAGTVNGKAGYGFLLSALDGDLTSKTSPDLLRLKVWDIESGEVVYDNNLGGTDSAMPATAIKGQISVKAR